MGQDNKSIGLAKDGFRGGTRLCLIIENFLLDSMISECQDSGSMNRDPNTLPGVVAKPLKTNRDDRGFFREIVRVTDPFFEVGNNFGQWSHSKMQKDVVKAWHYHHIQTDWWYLPIGVIETVLFDNRPESPTYLQKRVLRMGDSTLKLHNIEGSLDSETLEICLKIPPGVLHGCRVLTEEAHLFYITSLTYNPNEEGRFPYDAKLVGHNWGPNPITVENDRRTFEPTSIRTLIARNNS